MPELIRSTTNSSTTTHRCLNLSVCHGNSISRESSSGFRRGNAVFTLATASSAWRVRTARTPSTPRSHRASRQNLWPSIPEGVTDEQAAGLPIPAITALGSLELLGVTAGQRLVVMGANGAVGGYAVEMVRSRGAHVIATVRGDAEEAGRLGAEEVYDSAAVDVVDTLRASHPDGVDAVLDLINAPDAIRRDAEILKPGGSLVSTIYVADQRWFAEHQIKAYNIASLTNPFSSSQGLSEVARMLAEGTITARIRSEVELEGAGEILEKVRKGGLRGKAVIRL